MPDSLDAKEHPILFSDSMVRALLAGTKTQTRRIVKPQGSSMFPLLDGTGLPRGDWFISYPKYERVGNSGHRCPFGVPGDRLWVRESWAETHVVGMPASVTVYRAYDTLTDYGGPWKPSIHMPRWRSRITLEVTGVRAERVQEISEADARAEGITDGGCVNCGEHEPCGCAIPQPDARDAFCRLWGEINGPESWMANPWVWVVSFSVMKRGSPNA